MRALSNLELSLRVSSFWVADETEPEKAYFVALGEDSESTKMIANQPEDINIVPPSLNFVHKKAKHLFYCAYPGGEEYGHEMREVVVRTER